MNIFDPFFDNFVVFASFYNKIEIMSVFPLKEA
jgi:hypothetical protein